VTTPGGPAAASPTARTAEGLLGQALRADPARPLLTFHDDATGERTELSVATFANWVAKTANLLTDDLAAGPGDLLELRLPVHWQGAVWLQAAWAAGLAVRLGTRPAGDPEPAVAVVAHDPAAEAADPSGGDDPATGREVVSLGLGPLGLPRPGVVPDDLMAVDYDRTVHGHGDRFVVRRAPGPEDPALLVGATAYDQATLAGLAAAAATGSPPGGALLVTEPLHDLRTVLAGLLVPLATGVTVVLCRHVDPALLPARIAQEGAVAAVAEGNGPLPEWNRSVAEMP
jgi:uncharacterized protein (TIGR03089 family)